MYKRFWLNRERGVAFMTIEVKNETQGKNYLEADVEVADCGRRVNLEFACNKGNRNERLRKVRSMIEALQQVEKALAEYKFGKGNRHEFD